MTRLAFRSNASLGLSFEWLLDGQSLPALLGVPEDDRDMPYWVWLHGPPRGARIDEEDDARILIAVCSCGEPGCGRTTAFSVADGARLLFSTFISDSLEVQSDLSFTVSTAEFHACLAAMTASARAHHEHTTAPPGTT